MFSKHTHVRCPPTFYKCESVLFVCIHISIELKYSEVCWGGEGRGGADYDVVQLVQIVMNVNEHLWCSMFKEQGGKVGQNRVWRRQFREI